MNREIKFRAWDVFMKRMIVDIDPAIFLEPSEVFIPLQYIGIKDAHRKEIYESDVIKVGLLKGFFIVVYDQEYAQFRMKKPCCDTGLGFGTSHYRMVVVGNIYQHPNLVSSEKENENRAY